MFKRIARRAAATVMIAIAVLPLAACDVGGAKPEMKQADSSGFRASKQEEETADSAGIISSDSIGQHHFAIYISYHGMFEEKPVHWREVAFLVADDHIRNTGMPFNDRKLVQTVRACSKRALLLLE